MFEAHIPFTGGRREDIYMHLNGYKSIIYGFTHIVNVNVDSKK